MLGVGVAALPAGIMASGLHEAVLRQRAGEPAVLAADEVQSEAAAEEPPSTA